MRRRKSNWRSFGHGFMLAGLPMLAFAGADYLFAPPSGSTRSDVIVRNETIRSRFNEGATAPFGASGMLRASDATAASNETGVSRTLAAVERSKPEADDPQARLVASIQRELRRVGCYADDADGAWTDRTKVAMRAFNDSVHVSLGADRPDYILLTLLQGHSGKACSRSCNGGLNASAHCIDKTIEARRVPPAMLVPRQVETARAGQAITSSASTPVPVSPTWSTASAHVPQPVPPARRNGSSQGPDATTADTEARNLNEKSEPLPGRMTVGAPREERSEARQKVAVVPTEAISGPAPRAAAPVVRPSVSASSSSKARISRTFIELGRNSP